MNIKAKHTVGDAIHVKILYKDDRASRRYCGHVLAVSLHSGSHFPDRILYDVYLEQADAPHVRIQNLLEGFVLAGGPEIEEEAGEGLHES